MFLQQEYIVTESDVPGTTVCVLAPSADLVDVFIPLDSRPGDVLPYTYPGFAAGLVKGKELYVAS